MKSTPLTEEESLRILMTADVFFPDTVGGAGRVAYELGRQLCKRGHGVHVLARNPGGAFPSSEPLEETFFVHRFFVLSKQTFSLSFSEIRNSYAMAKKLHKEAPFDYLCAHQSLVAVGPVLLGSLRAVPLVYFFHSPWHEEYLLKKGSEAGFIQKVVASAMRQIERKLLFKACKIFVLSNYMAGKLESIHRIPDQKIVRIPAGLDLNRFQPSKEGKEAAKRKMGLPLEKTISISVRNLVPRMGIENLIEAFNQSRLLREKGLLLIGGEGFLKESLLAMVRKYDLEDSVHFLGRISEDDLPRYYQAADFFVLPTRELEGFGLVILESLACGTPVLGTPIGAIPETVGSFAKNLLFEGTHHEDIRRKLEDVINRPDDYRFDPQGCRNFVEERYSWEKMAEAFEREVIALCEV
jgi:glycosyltransferase involved in cell wall biosynthesis